MDTLLADADSPFYLGHEVRMRTTYTVEHLRMHPEHYRSGGVHSCAADGPEFSLVQKAMTNKSIPGAYLLLVIPSVPGLGESLDAGIKVLDVGCGSGVLIIELARAFPNSTFTGVEIDRFAVDDARWRIGESGLADRVSVEFAGAETVEYDGEFDLVNMALVLHEIPGDAKPAVLTECSRALCDSGEIVIFDFAYPESLRDLRKTQYTEGILDQFHEVTWRSEHISSTARHRLLLEHGFEGPVTVPLVDGSFEATHARKQAATQRV
jgi:SAM-dependent methyltransferase